jgi:hypothetical protein|tara:strand:+ start:1415 stop:1591 length:177 start_codon:yes stop_codon:yes gene_type:complete
VFSLANKKKCEERDERERKKQKRKKQRRKRQSFCFIKKKEKNETKILSRPIGGVGSIQ